MALAKRFAADLAATTDTDLTGGGLNVADNGTYLLNICNRTGFNVAVRFAITDAAAAPTDADWIEYGTVILPNDVLSRWPVPLSTGMSVWAWAGNAGVSVTLIGQKAV